MSGKFEAGGWFLFFVSGVFFVLIALRDGDALVMWSAAAWLLGVVSFALGRWGPWSGQADLGNLPVVLVGRLGWMSDWRGVMVAMANEHGGSRWQRAMALVDKRWLYPLVAIDLIFVGLHILLRGNVISDTRFNLSDEGGFPELFQAAKFVLIVLVLVAVYQSSRQRTYLAWGALFVYLLADDWFEIHEAGGSAFEEASWRPGGPEVVWNLIGEMVVSAIAATILLGLVWWFSRTANEQARTASKHFFILLVALVVFGVVIDIPHTLVEDIDLPRVIPGGLRVLEDGGEMVVISATLAYAIALRERVGLVDASQTRLKALNVTSDYETIVAGYSRRGTSGGGMNRRRCGREFGSIVKPR